MKRDMTDPRHTEWSKSVRTRDKYKCVACGKYSTWSHAHHMDGYDWAVSSRFDVSNGVCLCPGRDGCHMDFHKKYGNKNNTRVQFDDYLILYHGKTIAQLDL